MRSLQFYSYVVSYEEDLGISGIDFSSDFIKAVKKRFGHVESVCDFGSGNGFIGLSLLANGLCNHVTLLDKNPLAIKVCKDTVRRNQLGKNVSVCRSDVFKNVRKSEQWDIIIGNPPHHIGTNQQHLSDMKSYDPEWKVHQELYNTAGEHLKIGGSLLLIEDIRDSKPAQWKRLIEETNDLIFIKAFRPRIIRLPNTKRLDYLKMVSNKNNSSMIASGLEWILNPIAPYYIIWSKKQY
ncbi:MAG: methyltransferase [Candidatus Micrarchaeota archaeon]|nr:methyltransferase [Candidatus Micrarchaeota archaeon]MDE1846717.1 methyltransferase [Candidatus Micrarchaeota archaeon]